MLIQLSKTNVPRNLRGPVLIDSFGFLRYWATVWSTVAAAGLAESTHLKKLRHIESLYCHSDQLLGQSALDDALGNLDEHALSNILESWFVSIRNRPKTTGTDEKRWQTGLDFVSSVVSWVSKSHADNTMRSIEERLQRLSILYRQLHVSKAKPIESIRSLPATTVQALHEMLDPQSPTNPFPRIRTRWRVEVYCQ